MAVVDGQPLVVTVSEDEGVVLVFDLVTGRELGGPLTVPGYGAGLATAVVKNRPVVLAGGLDGSTRMWDLTNRQPMGEPLVKDGFTLAVATAVVGGRPVAVTVTGVDDDECGTVRVWDLGTGGQIGRPLSHGSDGAAVIAVDGKPVVVTSDRGDVLRMWDPVTGRQLGEPLSEQGKTRAQSVATGVVDGRPIVTACGVNAGAHMARAWDLATRQQIGSDLVFPHPVWTAAVWNRGLVVGFGVEVAVLTRR